MSETSPITTESVLSQPHPNPVESVTADPVVLSTTAGDPSPVPAPTTAGDPFTGEISDADIAKLLGDNSTPPEELGDTSAPPNEIEAAKGLNPDEVDINVIRKHVKQYAEIVRGLEADLDRARKDYRDAGRAEAQFTGGKGLSLAQLNEIQRRVCKTEDNRKARAMRALSDLGFGNRAAAGRKPHPNLF